MSIVSVHSHVPFLFQKVYTYEIPESVVEEASSDLQPLNQKDLHRLLSDPETRDFLFPGGILYVHRVPYKLTEGNFPSIFNKRTVLFGSPSRNNKYKACDDWTLLQC